MSKWKTKETITTTREREWALTVCDYDRGVARPEYDGGPNPTPADYIAALRAEPEEVRAEVMIGIMAALGKGALWSTESKALDRVTADLAAVTAERDSLREEVERLTSDRRPLAPSYSEVSVRDSAVEDGPVVVLRPLSNREGQWAPLSAVLAAAAEKFSGSILAAADKLRATAALDASGGTDRYRPARGADSEPEEIRGRWVDAHHIEDPAGDRVSMAGTCVMFHHRHGHHIMIHHLNVLAILDRAGLLPKADRETRAKLALLEWTRGGDRLIAQRASGGFVTFFSEAMGQRDGEVRDTALALCARLGIKVE